MIAETLGKFEQTARFEDERRNIIVLCRELAQWQGFTVLQTFQHCVVAHELAEVDVVSFMNRSERSRDNDSDACPSFALCCRFTA